MRDHAGQVVDGGELVRLDRIEVMQPRSEARHLLPYLFVQPTPRSDDHKVRAIAHQHPGVEKRVQVLAGLDGADEQDETLRQLQPCPGLRSFLGAHRPEFLRDPMGTTAIRLRSTPKMSTMSAAVFSETAITTSARRTERGTTTRVLSGWRAGNQRAVREIARS